MFHEHFFELDDGRVAVQLLVCLVRWSGTNECRVLEVLVVQLKVELGLENLQLKDGNVLKLFIEDLDSLVHTRKMIVELSKCTDFLELCCSFIIEVISIK